MNFTAKNIPCESCGATMVYSPKYAKLNCKFCYSQTDIPLAIDRVISEDYHSATHSHPMLDEDSYKGEVVTKNVTCAKCNANFKLSPKSFAEECPYCNTPVIIDCIQDITPHGILPFLVTGKEAQKRFKIWVGSRWFAPNAFKEYLNSSKKLVGYYFPYWAYDTRTITTYQGQRGDRYYVTVTKTVMINGREEQRNVQESRIDWSYRSGMVEVSFDDVTIGASNTIERSRLDEIDPWSCETIEPFNINYISGFKAEEYSIDLKEGFTLAKDKMKPIIENRIRRDIGGDEQRINSTTTKYNNITYKNLLFPVWIASFKFKDTEYSYAINGRTGRVAGDRPYSYIKIALAVISALAVAGTIYYFNQNG